MTEPNPITHPKISEADKALVEALMQGADDDDAMTVAIVGFAQQRGVGVEHIGRTVVSENGRTMRQAATRIETLLAQLEAMREAGSRFLASVEASIVEAEDMDMFDGIAEFRAALKEPTP